MGAKLSDRTWVAPRDRT